MSGFDDLYQVDPREVRDLCSYANPIRISLMLVREFFVVLIDPALSS
jgi:hypothetical protein